MGWSWSLKGVDDASAEDGGIVHLLIIVWALYSKLQFRLKMINDVLISLLFEIYSGALLNICQFLIDYNLSKIVWISS
jgi:hypothetical protein